MSSCFLFISLIYVNTISCDDIRVMMLVYQTTWNDFYIFCISRYLLILAVIAVAAAHVVSYLFQFQGRDTCFLDYHYILSIQNFRPLLFTTPFSTSFCKAINRYTAGCSYIWPFHSIKHVSLLKHIFFKSDEISLVQLTLPERVKGLFVRFLLLVPIYTLYHSKSMTNTS